MPTPKERAIKAFKGQAPDRIPVCAFLGGTWPINSTGESLKTLAGNSHKTAQILYEVNERLDNDIITVGTGSTPFIFKALGAKVRFNQKGSPDILSEVISDEKDLEKVGAIRIHDDPDIQWMLEYVKILFSLFDDQRLILSSVRGPFTIASQLYGVERFSRALYKNSDLAHRMLEFATCLIIDFIKPFLAKDASHGVSISDPSSSGDLISRKHFEEFAAPYLKRVLQEVDRYQGFKLLHICGNVSDRLVEIADTGINCLSVDAKVDIAEAKAEIGGRVCIAGNVDPVKILNFGSEREIYHESLHCLEQGAKNGGFVLMPGCDLAPGVPEKNIKLFIETAHQWKGEP